MQWYIIEPGGDDLLVKGGPEYLGPVDAAGKIALGQQGICVTVALRQQRQMSIVPIEQFRVICMHFPDIHFLGKELHEGVDGVQLAEVKGQRLQFEVLSIH